MEPAAEQNADRIARLVDRIVQSYHDDRRTQHLDSPFLPNRQRVIHVLELLRRMVFPGFFDDQRLHSETIHYHVGELLTQVREILYEQVRDALRYRVAAEAGVETAEACERCDERALQIVDDFLACLPEVRRVLATDVQAAFDGDPAAVSTDETVFCYPGVYAIFVHRIAHALWRLDVPLIPRIVSEHVHNETGIDIHPGATIGESFFIDHGTGVVIGETAVIGNRVKLYQNVTLGALSTKGGQAWRGRKRHPTLEDDVTVYSGATILGGETVIGARCTVNGSAFLTRSVPPDHTVRVQPPEAELRARKQRAPDQTRAESP